MNVQLDDFSDGDNGILKKEAQPGMPGLAIGTSPADYLLGWHGTRVYAIERDYICLTIRPFSCAAVILSSMTFLPFSRSIAA